MTRKKSRREALRAFNRQQDDLAGPDHAHLRADRKALEAQVDAAWHKYQVCRAVNELQELRANGGWLQ